MTYDLAVTDRFGRALRVHGVKRLVRGARPEIWADSTSLTTEVRDEAAGRVVAAGILRISVSGFLRQLATFRATAATARGRAGALARFGGFFADQLSQVYVRPVRPVPPPPWFTAPRPAAAPALTARTTRTAPTAGTGTGPAAGAAVARASRAGPRRGGDPSGLRRVGQCADELAAGPDTEFAVRAGQVVLDRLRGQEQLNRGLGVGRTVRRPPGRPAAPAG